MLKPGPNPNHNSYPNDHPAKSDCYSQAIQTLPCAAVAYSVQSYYAVVQSAFRETALMCKIK